MFSTCHLSHVVPAQGNDLSRGLNGTVPRRFIRPNKYSVYVERGLAIYETKLLVADAKPAKRLLGMLFIIAYCQYYSPYPGPLSTILRGVNYLFQTECPGAVDTFSGYSPSERPERTFSDKSLSHVNIGLNIVVCKIPVIS